MDDTYASMKRWVWFRSNESIPSQPLPLTHDFTYYDDKVWSNMDNSSPTIIRDGAKIGRNDPCPCGSGKKYKKCCLH